MGLEIDLKNANGTVVYSTKITHNLNTMAEEAGIYECLWRPEEHGITVAAQVVEPLAAGLELLIKEPTRFKAFEESNEWGKWRDFVPFCAEYLEACQRYPAALVVVSR